MTGRGRVSLAPEPFVLSVSKDLTSASSQRNRWTFASLATCAYRSA